MCRVTAEGVEATQTRLVRRDVSERSPVQVWRKCVCLRREHGGSGTGGPSGSRGGPAPDGPSLSTRRPRGEPE